MFGLQDEKGKEKGKGQAFDLEKELTGPEKTTKLTEYKKLISGRVEGLKNALRQGEDKAEFTKSEVLLNGYTALQQVVERVAR